MHRVSYAAVLTGLVTLHCCLPARGDDKSSALANWPAFRGPLATGVAPKADPPVEWSEEKNVKWKVAIPGRGHATPIVWGDRIYIQTAVQTEKEAAKAAADPFDFGTDIRVVTTDSTDGSLSANGEMRTISNIDAVAFAQPTDPPPPDRPRRRGQGGRRRQGGEAPKHIYEFQVLALDRTTGKTVWTKTVREEKPHESGHTDASQASNSPVTDGEHLYAYFGSRGLYCMTLDGKVVWETDLGDMRTRNEFGEGSSPVVHGDTVIVVWDHEGDDFIVAFDKKTGKQRWKVNRDESTSWSTPIVVEAGGKPQVVVVASNAIRAYDLATGKEVWNCRGMTQNTIPSPMVQGDLLYCISGFRGAACLAIRYAEAKGDITDSDTIVWSYDKDTPYVPSALLYNNRLWFVENNRPLLTCLNAKTGKPVIEKTRLEGIDGIYSSFLGADGRIYIVGRNGTTLVLKDAPKLEVLATNKLEDHFDASPAAGGNELFLRGNKHLYCIAGE